MCLSTDIDMLPLGPADLLPSKPPDCNSAAGVALGPEARSWPRAGGRTDLILAFQCADCQYVASDLMSERGIGDENCHGNMFHSASRTSSGVRGLLAQAPAVCISATCMAVCAAQRAHRRKVGTHFPLDAACQNCLRFVCEARQTAPFCDPAVLFAALDRIPHKVTISKSPY